MGKRQVKSKVAVGTYLWLNSLAEERGSSISEIIRQWIEEKRDQSGTRSVPKVASGERIN